MLGSKVQSLPGYLPDLFAENFIKMNTIKELIKDPSTIVVDVRSPWEYEKEHIPGAKNIPLEEINSFFKNVSIQKISLIKIVNR